VYTGRSGQILSFKRSSHSARTMVGAQLHISICNRLKLRPTGEGRMDGGYRNGIRSERVLKCKSI
jgi:hypothetical protein